MRIRTKLFITSVMIVLALWAGSLWPIERMISSHFEGIADANFAGARQGLRSLQMEHVNRMRQVGTMVMEIPELRALIAENNFEVSAENQESLRERLDNLTQVMAAKFVCVLDGRGALIAQNSSSPWPSLSDLRTFVSNSPQARPFVQRLFASAHASAQTNQAQNGLWFYQGQLYQVVGLPLVFSAPDDPAAAPDGALIIAEPITNELAANLGNTHQCEITFVTGGTLAATSLLPPMSNELLRLNADNHWPSSEPFNLSLKNESFRSFVEPLFDPCSGTQLGVTIIQSSLAQGEAQLRGIVRSLLAIMLSGLLAAAIASFLISAAITRPVQNLLVAVRKVADGDLNSSIQITRRDEIGEVAGAFNDMVTQLRTRRELQRLVEESQAASKAKSQFLANMSHEIRTPLHGVSGIADLLLSTDLGERQRHYARLIKSSAEVLGILINDILDFSKIEAGKLELESIDFEPTKVVEDVVEILSQKASGKGVEIACFVANDVPGTVRGDGNRLRQILMNLVGNAIKFTETGEIIVRVSREDFDQQKIGLRFAVSDTGIGIPADRVDRLFKSFSQVDASTTRRYGGTGLGLAISKQLAELMGGAIGVESEMGRGSRFWFTANFVAANAPPFVCPVGLSGMRALIVDDNRAVGGILQDMLKDAGIDAHAGFSAEECHGQLDDPHSAGGFSVVLLDQLKPTFDVVRWKAEASARGRKLPVFILLAAANESKAPAYAEAGFDGCIVKPVRRCDLLQAVACAVGAQVPNLSAPEAANEEHLRPIHPTRRFRVLIAEDNEVNQIVAGEFLAKLGCVTDIVGDGRSAVSAQIEKRYDLILMDCQMPVLDGFEASQAIRAHESADAASGRPLRPVPIIALTANASGADRQRCFEAGMNAYCEKPFRTKDLIEKISGFLSDNDSAGSSAENDRVPAAIAREKAAAPINLDSFLIQCTGSARLALTILEKFEKQALGAILQLEKLLSEGNAEQIARVSHSLKGTAGILAAESLRQALARMEELARANSLDHGQECLAQLRDEIDRCASYLPQARAALKENLARQS